MMKSICTNNLIAFCGTAGLSKSAASASNNCRGRKQVGKERKRKPHMNQTPAQRRAVSHTPRKTNQPKHSLPLSYCRNIYSAFPDLCLASWQATPQKESLPLASPSSAKQESSPFPELCKGRKREQAGCSGGLHLGKDQCQTRHTLTGGRVGISSCVMNWSKSIDFVLITLSKEQHRSQGSDGFQQNPSSSLNGHFFPFPTKHDEALKRI